MLDGSAFQSDVSVLGRDGCISALARPESNACETMEKFAETYKWIVSNWTNILAGIVASIIVLTLQVVVRALSLALAALVTLRWRLKLLWRLGKIQRVYVVSGAISGVSDDVQSAILAGPDATAASTLIAMAGLLYPKAEISHVYSSSFPRDLYKEHMIVVGGPVNNICTATIFQFIGNHISFTDDFEMIFSEVTYETTYDDDDKPIRDHGAIIRIDNPFDPSKNIIMAVGCDTYGVLAAALLISTRPDARRARAKLFRRLGFRKYFRPQRYIAVVGCDIIGNDIGQVWLRDFSRIKTD